MSVSRTKRTKVKEKSLLKRNTEKTSDLFFTHSRTKKSNKSGPKLLTSQKFNTLLKSETNQEQKTETHPALSEERITPNNNKTTQEIEKPNCTENSKSIDTNSAASNPSSFTNTRNCNEETEQGNVISSVYSQRLWHSISTPQLTYEEHEGHSAYFRGKFRFVIHILRNALLETISDIHALREKISSHLPIIPQEGRKLCSDSDLLTKRGVNFVQPTRIYPPSSETSTSVSRSTKEDETWSSTNSIDSLTSKSFVKSGHTTLEESDCNSSTTITSVDTVRHLDFDHHEIQKNDSQLLQNANENPKLKNPCEENVDTGTKCNTSLSNETLKNANELEENVENVIPHPSSTVMTGIKKESTSEVSMDQETNNITSSHMSEKMNSSLSFLAHTLSSEENEGTTNSEILGTETSRTIEASAKSSQTDSSTLPIEPPCKKACHDHPQLITSIYHLLTNNVNPLYQNVNDSPTCCSTDKGQRNPNNIDTSVQYAFTNKQTARKALTRKRLRFFHQNRKKREIDEDLSEKIRQIQDDGITSNLNKHSNTKSVIQSFDGIVPKTDLQKCHFGSSSVSSNPGIESILQLPASTEPHGPLANSFQSPQNVGAPSALAQRNYRDKNAPHKTFLVTDLEPAVNSSVIPRSVVVQLCSATLPSSTDIFRKPISKRKLNSPSETSQIISESVSTEQDINVCKKNVNAQMYIENLKTYATKSGPQSAQNYFLNMELFPFQQDSLLFSDSTSNNGWFIHSQDATTSTVSGVSKDDSNHQSQPISENSNTGRITSMSGITPQFLRCPNSFFRDGKGCNSSLIPEKTKVHSERPFLNPDGNTLRVPKITKSSPYLFSEAQNNSAMSYNPLILPVASSDIERSQSQIQESMIHRNVQINPRIKRHNSGPLSTLIELPEYTPVSSAHQSQYHNSRNGMEMFYSKGYPLHTLDPCYDAISDTMPHQAQVRVFASVGDTPYFPTQGENNCENPGNEHVQNMEQLVHDKNVSFIKEDSSLNRLSNSKHTINDSKNRLQMPSSSMKYPFMKLLPENWRKEVKNAYTSENSSARNVPQHTMRTSHSHLMGDSVDKTYGVIAPIPILPQPQVNSVDNKVPGTRELSHLPLVSESKCTLNSRDVSNAAWAPRNPSRVADNQVFQTIRVDSSNYEYPSEPNVNHSGEWSVSISEAAQCSVHDARKEPALVLPHVKKYSDRCAPTNEQSPDFARMSKNAFGSTLFPRQTPNICQCPSLSKLGKQDDMMNNTASTTEQKVHKRKILKARRRISRTTVDSHSIISVDTKKSSRQLLEQIIETDGHPANTRNSTTEKNQCFTFSNDYFAQLNNDSQHVHQPHILQNRANIGPAMPFYQQFNTGDCVGQNLSTGVTTRYDPMNAKLRAPEMEQQNPFTPIVVPSCTLKNEPHQMVGYKAYKSKKSEEKPSVKTHKTKIDTPNSKMSGYQIFQYPPNIFTNNIKPFENCLGTGKKILHSSQSCEHDTQTNEKDVISIPLRRGVSLPSTNSQNNFYKNYSSRILRATSPFRKISHIKKTVPVYKTVGVQTPKSADDLPFSNNFPTSNNLPSNSLFAKQDKNTNTYNTFRHFNCSENSLLTTRIGEVDSTFIKKEISQSHQANQTNIPLNNDRTSNVKQNVTQKILPTFNFKSPLHLNRERRTRKLDKRVEQRPSMKIKSVDNSFSPNTVPSSLRNRKGTFPQDYSGSKCDTSSLMNQYKLSLLQRSANNTPSMERPLGSTASDFTFELPSPSFSQMKKCCDPTTYENKSNNLLEIQPRRFYKHYSQGYVVPKNHEEHHLQNSKSQLSIPENDFAQNQPAEPFLPQISNSKLPKWVTNKPFSLPRCICHEDFTGSYESEATRLNSELGNCTSINKYILTEPCIKARGNPVFSEFQKDESGYPQRHPLIANTLSEFATSRTQSNAHQISQRKPPTFFLHKCPKLKTNVFLPP